MCNVCVDVWVVNVFIFSVCCVCGECVWMCVVWGEYSVCACSVWACGGVCCMW